jgi:hypothetical protein
MLDTTVDSLVPADIQSIADLAQISHFEVAVPIQAQEPSHIHVPRPSRLARARRPDCAPKVARAGD